MDGVARVRHQYHVTRRGDRLDFVDLLENIGLQAFDTVKIRHQKNLKARIEQNAVGLLYRGSGSLVPEARGLEFRFECLQLFRRLRRKRLFRRKRHHTNGHVFQSVGS